MDLLGLKGFGEVLLALGMVEFEEDEFCIDLRSFMMITYVWGNGL